MIQAHDTATLPAELPGAGPNMRMVAIATIVASTTNPRKTFNAEKLRELADSIKASEVHQPILLRPLPASRVAETSQPWKRADLGQNPWPFAKGLTRNSGPIEYELVAGERRWRASQMAGKVEIPAMIRELTDEQALEVQVIENLQREDVTELEEAEGYEVLMRTGNLNADQVAAKIGKSRSYVYGRLKVLELCSKAREALRDGKIDFSRGLLIARIPDEALQLKALHFCEGGGYYGEPPGYRRCAEHVQQNYMLKLSSAKFKITDASLVAKAGSCKDCSKRTGANPDLFQDVSADVCTDPKCFRTKEEAHENAIKRTALEHGAHIIEGREAKALMPSAYSGEVKGYLRLDDKTDSPTDKPLRKLIGKAMEQQGIQPTLVVNPHKDGELVAVLTPDQVETLLKAADHKEAAAKIEAGSRREEQAMKEQAKKEAITAYEVQWRWDVLVATWKEITNGTHEAPAEAVLRHVARNIARTYNQDRAKKLCKLLDLGKVAPRDGLLQYIDSTEAPGDALQLLVMFDDVEYRYWLDNGADANKGLHLVAKDYGIDVEVVKVRAKADQRAAAKAQAEREAKKPAPAAAPEGASTPKPAAQPSTTRARTKGKNAPAAQARATAPKTSTEEASALISAALTDAEAQIQAPAAQGNEGLAVADAQPGTAPSGSDGAAAQAHDQAPTAHGDEAPPAAPAPATPAPTAKTSASAKKGAAVSEGLASEPVLAQAWPFPKPGNTRPPATAATPAPAAALEIFTGTPVRVSTDVYAADKQIYAGKRGTVVGPLKGFKNTWRVTFDQADVGEASPSASFKAAELEVVAQ